MIAEERMHGTIDQIDGVVYFKSECHCSLSYNYTPLHTHTHTHTHTAVYYIEQ